MDVKIKKYYLLMISCFFVFILFSASGCATSPKEEAIPEFRQGVVIIQQQINSEFNKVNEFILDQKVEYIVDTHAFLNEKYLSEMILAEDIEKWNLAFSVLEKYATGLESLLSNDFRDNAEKSLDELSVQVGNLRNDELPLGIGGAIAYLGGLLVEEETNKSALRLSRRANPAIQGILSKMGEAIGSNVDSGVRGTVRSSWRTLLTKISYQDYALEKTKEKKREAVEKYLTALKARDEQDERLLLIRKNLLSLASSHEDISKGERKSAIGKLSLIKNEYIRYLDKFKNEKILAGE